MSHDPVADWHELSVLYEHAEQLDHDALDVYLQALPPISRRLLPQLERMLGLRAQVMSEGFLETFPQLTQSRGPSSREPGNSVGPYRLVRRVGQGGMAEVWLAARADGAFDRNVAIKLPYHQSAYSRHGGFVERFKRERDILASLDHPNIARLHDAGVAPDGQPWLALDYVDGQPITDWCDSKHLTIEKRIRVFRQVLMAVEYAHANLVIHRDLKPSNIIVTEQGEVRLLDFGIAKLLDDDASELVDTHLTIDFGRPLTPLYTSPEQIQGHALTTGCDIYSLGVILYELLVGELPYESTSRQGPHLAMAVLDFEPKAPSRRALGDGIAAYRSAHAKALQRELRPELDAIVLCALRKEARQRHESVAAMRAELDRWLRHEPVLVTAPGAFYRFGKFLRRHPIGVASSGLAVAVLATVAGFSLLQSLRVQQQTAQALASKEFLLGMFRLVDPSHSRGENLRATEVLDAGLDRANKLLGNQPDLRAEVLKNIAEIDQNLGRYARAGDALGQTADIYAAAGHRKDWAGAEVELAFNSFMSGNPQSAEATLEKATSTLAEFSTDQKLQARQYEVRGWVSWALGSLKESKQDMMGSLSSALAGYGPNDNHTADALRGLAFVESQMNDYDDAAHHIAQAHETVLRSPNATPIDVVGVETEQARMAYVAGDLAQAEVLMAAATKDCDAALGPGHEDCFYGRATLAAVFLQTRRFGEAMRLVPSLESEAGNDLSPRRKTEAVIVASRVLSANHALESDPALRGRLEGIASASNEGTSEDLGLWAQQTLVEIALREGRAEDADRMAERLLHAADSKESPTDRAKLLMFRGVALQLLGRHAEALGFLIQSDDAYVQALGPAHTVVLLCRLNQVLPLMETGASARAINLLETTLPVLRKRLPQDSPVLHDIDNLRNVVLGPPRAPRAAGPAVFFL